VSDGSIERTRTAVVLYDIINAGIKPRDAAAAKAIKDSGLVANLVRLVAAVRPYRVPVMWIVPRRRPDRLGLPDNVTDLGRGWAGLDERESALIDEVVVQPEDQLVFKPRRDPFIGTDLDLHLRARGVDTILLGGYATNWGVESTARTAFDLGYDVIVLSDCCTNADVDLHRFAIEKILPRFARVMTADDALGRFA
jgi:nicotinamidase-related amidase